MIPIIVLLIAIFCMMKKSNSVNADYLSISKTFSIRGIMAVAICFSHVLSYGNGFYIHRFLFPSTVGIFFFYSGYGLLYQTLNGNKEGGKNHYFDHFFVKRLSRIVISSILIRLIVLALDWSILPDYELKTILDVLWTGMWFTKVIIVFYIGFWILFRWRWKTYKMPLILYCGFIMIFIVVCRLLGLSSLWYGNSFAFLLGLFWAAYRKQIDEILLRGRKRLCLTFGLVLLCLIGSSTVIILVEKSVISIAGPGLLAAFTISIAYPILWNLMMMKLDFRTGLWEKIGKFSFEMYIAETIGRRILLYITFIPKTCENWYAFALLILEMLCGYLVSQFSIWVSKGIRRRITGNG